jgi:hypothetical protein
MPGTSDGQRPYWDQWHPEVTFLPFSMIKAPGSHLPQEQQLSRN